MATQSALLGVVLLAIGIASGIGMFFTAKAIRDNRSRPLSTFTPVAVFDRARRVYRDGAGEPIAPLDQVRFERRMQPTSSSPKLVAVTPSGYATCPQARQPFRRRRRHPRSGPPPPSSTVTERFRERDVFYVFRRARAPLAGTG